MNRQLCEGAPFKSRSSLLTIWGLLLGPLAIIAIALRCYSRLIISREFGYDDTIIVAVGVFLASIIGLDVTGLLVLFLRENRANLRRCQARIWTSL